MYLELIGHIASFFVVVSLLMVNILRLRILNLIGATAFVIYGIMIQSLPIIITNGSIMLINMFHLATLFKFNAKDFSYIRIGEPRKAALEDFIKEHRVDIQRHFPLFDPQLLEEAFKNGGVYFALHGFQKVGFAFFTSLPAEQMVKDESERELLSKIHQKYYPTETVYLNVDYIKPAYRGLGLAQKLYQEIQSHLPQGKKFICAIGETKNRGNHRFLMHNEYKKVHFYGPYGLYLKKIAQ
jgi:GNAT superfamily N-acetyltransferase